MTRFEHHVTRGAQVTCGPAGPPGTHEIRIVDGAVTVMLRFGSAEEMAAFVMLLGRYVLAQPGRPASVVEMASTGVWGQGSAGQPVGESGEAGNVATTRALPADPERSAWLARRQGVPLLLPKGNIGGRR